MEDPQVVTKRIYLRDLSFESPRLGETHKEQWQPEVSLNLRPSHVTLSQDSKSLYEAKLHCSITCKNNKKIAYVIEIEQAGEFAIQGCTPEQTTTILNTLCPNMLFPYVREAVDNLLVRGGFPALMLMPVNFDQLYAQSTQTKHMPKNTEGVTTH